MISAKKAIKGLASLKVSSLEDKSLKEIWVINETKPKGIIILDIKNKMDGSPTLVTIPPTWIPICLTDQIPKSMLTDSPKFRSILSLGHIKLLDPKGVHEIIAIPEIAEEITAIKNKTSEMFKEQLPEAIKTEAISVIVLDILSREESKTITESEAKDILNNKEDELSNEDLEHLINNSNMAKVKKWAAEMITDRDSE
jgi:hypothetical protein